MSNPVRIGLVADFNTSNLGRMFEKHCSGINVKITEAPFGQVMQLLLDSRSEFWGTPADVIVLWTWPHSVVPHFNDITRTHAYNPDQLDREVDVFVDLVRNLEERVSTVFVPSWVVPAISEDRPALAMKSGVGTDAALLRMNLRLVDSFRESHGVVVFNTDRWVRQGGASAFSDKLWFLSKTPYSKTVFDEAARDMTATVMGIMGRRRKVCIVDLDNTLWGGVVGDLGWEGIQIGGHDPVGEAYVQFQNELKRLSSEGVLLAIASKNEQSMALEAIDRHPDMALRLGDFAAWRINWDDKALNVTELLNELNLGLDSAVFLDDSPYERSRIRQALPEVLVPEWPSDPMDYAKALRELRCFESPALSSEDRARTAMYVSDRERKELQSEVGSLEKWLEMLELEVHVEELSTYNLERTAQLLNKTNQMNLTTRRMSAQELAGWGSDENHRIWTFRVKDKLGDYGLCGIASLAFRTSGAELVDFVLSCRAMGRGIEEAIISVVADKIRASGCDKLSLTYVATKKNKPCIRWIERQSWFTRDKNGHTFVLDANRDVPSPKHIRIALSKE